MKTETINKIGNACSQRNYEIYKLLCKSSFVEEGRVLIELQSIHSITKGKCEIKTMATKIS